MRTRSAAVAGIFAFATAANAVGNAVINNYCSHDVYLWAVSVDESPSSPTIIKSNGGKWSQQYKPASSGGYSLKLSDDADMSSGITQFEYTLEANTIWYDISNVNCLPFGTGLCPFQKTGMYLKSGSGCPTANCAAGADTCHDAYTYPKDDWASLSCEPSADTVLDLCGNSSGGSSSGNGIIGQVTSLVGNLFGGGSYNSPTTSAYVAPTPTTSAYVAPVPTTTSTSSPPAYSSSSQQGPGGAYNNNGAVGIAAVPTSYSAPSVAHTTSHKPAKPKTTLVTTQAPAPPNVAVVYETVTEMVATTTVVYSHKMAHKAKREAHPHARRHQHEA